MMKTILLTLFTFMAAFAVEGVGAQSAATHKKSLIVYFSRPGNNYVNGKIVDLKLGNTEVVASKLQKLTGAAVFRIVPEVAYPDDYIECTEVAKKEQNADARPRYKGDATDWTSYDVIYLGYPNWWGTMPMVVWTFLAKHDFSGKTIRPFCTHEGSALGHSLSDIRKLCPKATIDEGLAIKGGTVAASDKSLGGWLQKLNKH